MTPLGSTCSNLQSSLVAMMRLGLQIRMKKFTLRISYFSFD